MTPRLPLPPLASLLAWLALAGCGDGARPSGDAGGAAGSPGAAGTVSGGSGQSGASGTAGAAGASGGGGQGGGGQGGGAGAAGDPCALWGGAEGHAPGQRLTEVGVSDPADGALAGLSGLRAGCERPGLLVVRVEPAWCAPCGLRDDRVAALVEPLPPGALDVVTVLYAGPDNGPTTDGDLARWRAAHPSLPGRLVRPTDGAAAGLLRSDHIVPWVLLVDRRTLRIISTLNASYEPFFRLTLHDALAEAGGPVIAPPETESEFIDGSYDATDWKVIQSLGAPLVLPPSPTNAHADDPAAAALGAQLFADPWLAGSGVACSTCHRADRGFSDGLPVAQGTGAGSLHTPSIATAAWNRWQFWDGRADTLWSQALGPLENPAEMNGSRLQIAHTIRTSYRDAFEAVFGPLPPLEQADRFPPAGKPGDAAYDAMAPDDRAAVDRVFVGVGKALEAFERTLRPAPTPRLEAYVAGQFDALTVDERAGLVEFMHAGCVSCHHGPTLSDGAFHNVLMPSHGPVGDRGRIDGIPRLLASPFRADGPFSDDPSAGSGLASLVATDDLLGQQKTPSLRGATRFGPWGHGGTFATLTDVVAHYGQGKPAELAGPRAPGAMDPAVAAFAPGHNAPIVAFLKMLGGD